MRKIILLQTHLLTIKVNNSMAYYICGNSQHKIFSRVFFFKAAHLKQRLSENSGNIIVSLQVHCTYTFTNHNFLLLRGCAADYFSLLSRGGVGFTTLLTQARARPVPCYIALACTVHCALICIKNRDCLESQVNLMRGNAPENFFKSAVLPFRLFVTSGNFTVLYYF